MDVYSCLDASLQVLRQSNPNFMPSLTTKAVLVRYSCWISVRYQLKNEYRIILDFIQNLRYKHLIITIKKQLKKRIKKQSCVSPFALCE